MKYLFFSALLILLIFSCQENQQLENDQSKNENFESIRIERYSVKNGNLDSLTFSSYIMKSFDEKGNEIKSVYHSTDNSIMMQFVNEYDGNNKTKIKWINADNVLVKYVKNTFDNDGRIVRSESYSPEDEFQSGFIHKWKENGKIEEKGPIEEEQEFKPNAIYTYNDDLEFEKLIEFDSNDSLYATVNWNYTEHDELGNWITRQMITNGTINRLEIRKITYSKN